MGNGTRDPELLYIERFSSDRNYLASMIGVNLHQVNGLKKCIC